MSIAIVGDVHGEIAQLREVLSELSRRRVDKVIFTGDYINRGPCSRQVIDALLELPSTVSSVFLWGNHELALVRYLRTGSLGPFLRLGGDATLKSYLPEPSGNVHIEFLRAFPSSHRRFLSRLRRCYETSNLLVSHAGCNPLRPADRSFRATVTAHHSGLFDPSLRLPKQVVCGHYVQRAMRPYVSPSVICLDTGCGSIGGPLSSIVLPEGELITSAATSSLSNSSA